MSAGMSYLSKYFVHPDGGPVCDGEAMKCPQCKEWFNGFDDTGVTI
jgi:hypothetical protein